MEVKRAIPRSKLPAGTPASAIAKLTAAGLPLSSITSVKTDGKRGANSGNKTTSSNSGKAQSKPVAAQPAAPAVKKIPISTAPISSRGTAATSYAAALKKGSQLDEPTPATTPVSSATTTTPTTPAIVPTAISATTTATVTTTVSKVIEANSPPRGTPKAVENSSPKLPETTIREDAQRSPSASGLNLQSLLYSNPLPGIEPVRPYRSQSEPIVDVGNAFSELGGSGYELSSIFGRKNVSNNAIGQTQKIIGQNSGNTNSLLSQNQNSGEKLSIKNPDISGSSALSGIPWLSSPPSMGLDGLDLLGPSALSALPPSAGSTNGNNKGSGVSSDGNNNSSENLLRQNSNNTNNQVMNTSGTTSPPRNNNLNAQQLQQQQQQLFLQMQLQQQMLMQQNINPLMFPMPGYGGLYGENSGASLGNPYLGMQPNSIPSPEMWAALVSGQVPYGQNNPQQSQQQGQQSGQSTNQQSQLGFFGGNPYNNQMFVNNNMNNDAIAQQFYLQQQMASQLAYQQQLFQAQMSGMYGGLGNGMPKMDGTSFVDIHNNHNNPSASHIHTNSNSNTTNNHISSNNNNTNNTNNTNGMESTPLKANNDNTETDELFVFNDLRLDSPEFEPNSGGWLPGRR